MLINISTQKQANKNSKVKKDFKLPPAILDIIAFAILGLLVGLVSFSSWGSPINGSVELGLYPATLIFSIAGFIFYVFAEYKYNHLKLKNVLLYLGAVIALMNILAVALLPNTITILDESLTITPLKRVEYLLCGIPFGLLPFAYFYLFPRKILNRHHLNIVLMLMLGFVLLTILLSPIFDWKRFANGDPLQSFFMHKGGFGLVLAMGIFLTITLRIQTKKWWWALFIIPIYPFLILSSAKVSLIAGTLSILIYIVIRLVQICKKNKDNLIIALSIVGFCILLSPLFIIGIIKSESGPLFIIKDYCVKALETIKTTLDSRIIIWKTTLKLVSDYHIIFGYGICSFAQVLHLAYTPLVPWDSNVGNAHNIALDLLGRGGILLLIICVALYVYLVRVAIKMRKNNYWLSVATIVFIALNLLIGSFGPTCLGLSVELMPSLVIITPIMTEYYMFIDKDEQQIRKDIVNNVRIIKNKQYKSKLLTLNKKRLLYEAKYIAYDLNAKIKL